MGGCSSDSPQTDDNWKPVALVVEKQNDKRGVVRRLDLPPVTVPVVKLLFAAPLGQPLHFVEA